MIEFRKQFAMRMGSRFPHFGSFASGITGKLEKPARLPRPSMGFVTLHQVAWAFGLLTVLSIKPLMPITSTITLMNPAVLRLYLTEHQVVILIVSLTRMDYRFVLLVWEKSARFWRA